MKRQTIIILSVILVIASFLFVYVKFDVFPKPLENRLKGVETFVREKILNISKKISNPGPLFGKKESSNVILTKEGILMWTNIQRKANSEYDALIHNENLDEVALRRLNDMFEKQYFEHVSPAGESASEEADFVGYEYIAIGENIALGNFDNDEALVQAWMDSPGHRANILSKTYREIGIAAKKGLYDGDEVWIAVQIFGRPLSDCTEPSLTAKAEIEKNQNELEVLKKEASDMYDLLQSLKNHNSTEYNEKVDEYNVIVNNVNNKIAQTKDLIRKYNVQATEFNTCLEN